MTVTDGCGNEVSEGDARIAGTAMTELTVSVGDAPYSGTYSVDYVATGVTGTTSGSLSFVVHGGKSCDGSGGSSGGGGHSGHGNGGTGGGGGGHNGGHAGGSGGGSGSEHQGGSGHGGSGSHEGTKHEGSDDHSGMAGMSDHKNMDHKGMNHKGMNHKGMNHDGNKHKNHKPSKNGGGIPPQASGDFQGATDIPTGTTVVIALGLAVLMGLIGGWVLRVSTPN
jgi:hypothetical protein